MMDMRHMTLRDIEHALDDHGISEVKCTRTPYGWTVRGRIESLDRTVIADGKRDLVDAFDALFRLSRGAG